LIIIQFREGPGSAVFASKIDSRRKFTLSSAQHPGGLLKPTRCAGTVRHSDPAPISTRGPSLWLIVNRGGPRARASAWTPDGGNEIPARRRPAGHAAHRRARCCAGRAGFSLWFGKAGGIEPRSADRVLRLVRFRGWNLLLPPGLTPWNRRLTHKTIRGEKYGGRGPQVGPFRDPFRRRRCRSRGPRPPFDGGSSSRPHQRRGSSRRTPRAVPGLLSTGARTFRHFSGSQRPRRDPAQFAGSPIRKEGSSGQAVGPWTGSARQGRHQMASARSITRTRLSPASCYPWRQLHGFMERRRKPNLTGA